MKGLPEFLAYKSLDDEFIWFSFESSCETSLGLVEKLKLSWLFI